jgi:hypothetical protein
MENEKEQKNENKVLKIVAKIIFYILMFWLTKYLLLDIIF